MKQVDVTLKLFIILCLTAFGSQAMAQTSTYTLAANGIGPVQLGAKALDLPESVPGLYDSKMSDVYIDEEMPDDEDMPEFATWYFYDEEGETLFTATQDSIGIITEITISSPNILTAEGLHVNAPRQQVDAIKGAQKIMPMPGEDYGRVSYQLNGITLWIDDFYIDDDHSEERVASITIPSEDNSDFLYEKVNGVISKVYPHYLSSNSLPEMENHLDEIRSIDGVKDAYSNGSTTLFVELDGGGSLGFSYFPKPDDVTVETIESFINGTTNIARYPYTKERLDKFSIAFQMGNDRRFDNEKKHLDKAEAMLQKCGLKGNIQEASLDFFLNDMYNYDYVFINTHGFFNKNTGIHWLMTSTIASISTEREEKEILNDQTMSREEKFEAFLNEDIFKTYKQHFLDNLISYTFHNEDRGLIRMFPTCYITVSEDLIKYSKNRFNHQGYAIVFNSACESLTGNNGLADAFINNGACAYIGYDAINDASRLSGLEFFGRLFSGMTIKKAYETIDERIKSNWMTNNGWGKTWTAELKLICPQAGEHNRMYPQRADHQFNIHKIDPTQNNTLDNQAIQVSTTYEIPLFYYTSGSKFFLNQNYKAIPLEYGFELCKNSGFSKGDTFTIRMGINEDKVIPVNNEDIIHASCQLNGDKVIIQLSFDMPIKHYSYWDLDQKYMHLRPIIFSKNSNPINTGGTYHLYIKGSRGFTNCCHVANDSEYSNQ